MLFEERVRLIVQLDLLIKRRFKGSAAAYAAKMNISRSTFFRLLDYLKREMNAPIIYRKDRSYYEYHRNGIMFIGFLPSEFLTEEGGKKVKDISNPYISQE